MLIVPATPSDLTRRFFMGALGPGLLLAQQRATDVRIDDITYNFEDYHLPDADQVRRHGGGSRHAAERQLRRPDRGGKSAKGFGSMPLGNVWSFPSKMLTYETTLDAMKVLAGRVATITDALQGVRPSRST